MSRNQHWQTVYSTKKSDEVSWFEAHPEQSVALIQQSKLANNSAIIDVGAGASKLVDVLLTEGYEDITCLDVSQQALIVSQNRLGKSADKVNWIATDITELAMSKQFDLWHDRAVFHFLTDETDRVKYLNVLKQHLRPNGQVIMATFSPDGPLKCSGLDIVQYDADALAETLGSDFTLLNSMAVEHTTPMGQTQAFIYCHFIKRK